MNIYKSIEAKHEIDFCFLFTYFISFLFLFLLNIFCMNRYMRCFFLNVIHQSYENHMLLKIQHMKATNKEVQV